MNQPFTLPNYLDGLMADVVGTPAAAMPNPATFDSSMLLSGGGGGVNPMEGFTWNSPTGFGYASLGLQGLGSLANAFMGYKQYQVAKDTLKENKRQFNMNWGAQKALTNAQLQDRQAARVASNPNAYTPVDVYMNQNGIK